MIDLAKLLFVPRGKRRGGELGVNKKGTPLYSREDIREQYCINDKELQVSRVQNGKLVRQKSRQTWKNAFQI